MLSLLGPLRARIWDTGLTARSWFRLPAGKSGTSPEVRVLPEAIQRDSRNYLRG
jgi:hypothetical protein